MSVLGDRVRWIVLSLHPSSCHLTRKNSGSTSYKDCLSPSRFSEGRVPQTADDRGNEARGKKIGGGKSGTDPEGRSVPDFPRSSPIFFAAQGKAPAPGGLGGAVKSNLGAGQGSRCRLWRQRKVRAPQSRVRGNTPAWQHDE